MRRVSGMLLFTTFLAVRLSIASPFSPLSPSESFTSIQPEVSELAQLSNSTLQERGCANPCGYNGWLCCGANQYCYTDSSNQAQCGNNAATTAAPTGNGYWAYYTSTWIETQLVTKTSVYSSWVQSYTPAATAYQTGAPVNCQWSSGESSCGNICCASNQYCVTPGQCAAAGSGSITSQYSAPLRPTSSTLVIATATLPTTTTVPYIAPIATGQMMNVTATQSNNSSGLSGGAIAGIVIGVLAAIFLIVLLLIFLCCRAIFDACFGRRKRGTRRETVEYSSYHRDGRSGSGWYGGGYNNGPRRVERREEKRKGGFGWPAIAAALGGVSLGLGAGNRNRRREEEKSEYSDYTYESYSEDSSDRRTRDTRRSVSRSRR